jgi:hypothetical protein
MNRLLVSIASLFLAFSAASAFAADEYNDVPAGDAQYKQCKTYASKLGWEGGNAKSPIAGQTKLEAFCTCMWNETPDDFKGNLATFAESAKGKKINNICEKYSNWHS